MTMLKSPALTVSTLKLTNNGTYDKILKLTQCRTLQSVSVGFCFWVYHGLSEVKIAPTTSVLSVLVYYKIMSNILMKISVY